MPETILEKSAEEATTPEPEAYTVDGFCEAYQMSREMLYRLWRRDEGPERRMVGTRPYIGREAGRCWFKNLPKEREN